MKFELSSEANVTSRFLPMDSRPRWRPLSMAPAAASFAQVLAKQAPGPGTAAMKSATVSQSPPPTKRVAQPTGAPAYAELISRASRQYGVDRALISAVIESESGFNPNAVSQAGAKGLMQLMDGTARGLGVSDSFDPTQNVMGGTRLLRQLIDRYNGDVQLALAAYNAGPGAVAKYGGVPPFGETQRYIPRVLSAMQRYSPTEGLEFRSVPQRSEQWR